MERRWVNSYHNYMHALKADCFLPDEKIHQDVLESSINEFMVKVWTSNSCTSWNILWQGSMFEKEALNRTPTFHKISRRIISQHSRSLRTVLCNVCRLNVCAFSTHPTSLRSARINFCYTAYHFYLERVVRKAPAILSTTYMRGRIYIISLRPHT